MIKLKIGYHLFYIILLVALLSWNPALLYSGKMNLSTYYPAPYAGYVTLLTRNDAYLARGSGSSVYIGANPSVLSSSANGDKIVLSGTNPEINILTTPDAIKIQAGVMSNVAGNGNVPYLGLNANVRVQGTLKNICELYSYTSPTSRNTRGVTYCGSTTTRTAVHPASALAPGSADERKSFRYTIVGVNEMHSNMGYYMGFPAAGWMLCCRFAYK